MNHWRENRSSFLTYILCPWDKVLSFRLELWGKDFYIQKFERNKNWLLNWPIRTKFNDFGLLGSLSWSVIKVVKREKWKKFKKYDLWNARQCYERKYFKNIFWYKMTHNLWVISYVVIVYYVIINIVDSQHIIQNLSWVECLYKMTHVSLWSMRRCRILTEFNWIKIGLKWHFPGLKRYKDTRPIQKRFLLTLFLGMKTLDPPTKILKY